MVQETDVASQARSIIGRFPDLAGKRALVTGAVETMISYVRERTQVRRSHLQPMQNVECAVSLGIHIQPTSYMPPGCARLPCTPRACARRCAVWVVGTSCQGADCSSLPAVCRRLRRHRPRRGAGAERQRRDGHGARPPQGPPGRGRPAAARGNALTHLITMRSRT
jgi:hypothetical protein